MSGHKRKITYSPEARQDLNDILHYSAQRWGRDQRMSYRQRLKNAARALAVAPLIGRSADYLRPGLRGHPVGSHVIYYWVHDDRIAISRILYERRDAESVDWYSGDVD